MESIQFMANAYTSRALCICFCVLSALYMAPIVGVLGSETQTQKLTGGLDNTFLFGAHVYRVPPPEPNNVLADMATMKSLGMNLANIQESWAWDNPQEGEYDFSHLVTLVEEAQRLGLMVSVTVTMEIVPKWVWDKYPDCRLLNAYNEPYEDPTPYVMPADGKPGPCWDHEGIKREAEVFLHEIAKIMAPYEHMIYWNVWQEAHLWSLRSGASLAGKLMPYNPETLDKYRSHLREKYTSLFALNGAWKTRYGSWDEIDPPRMYFSVPSFIDWSRYIQEGYLADTLAWRRRTLLRFDPRKRPVAAHTATPYFGTTCEFFWSKKLDMYGTSFYPTVSIYQHWEERHGLMNEVFSRYQELWSSLFHINYSRCASGKGPRFMIHETASGPYNEAFKVRGEVSAADMRRWLLLQLAGGGTGTILWNTRPEHFWNEAQGQGFLDGEGGLTPRAREIGAFGKAVAKHGALLARSVKPIAPVALFQDEDLFRFAQGSGEVGLVVESLRGCYKACFDAGVDADFVDGNRIDRDDLAKYRIIIHPFPAVMSDAVAKKLAHYVKGGGTLICGPVPSRFEEYGFARPRYMSPVVEALFGVSHASLRQVAEFESKSRWTPRECRYGDLVPATRLIGTGPLDGLNPKAAYYIQTFDTKTAESILTWQGRVVGTQNHFGRGMAYLLGTNFAYSILGEKCQDAQQAFERIIGQSGLKRKADAPLLIYRRQSEFGELLFVLNPTPESAIWQVSIPENAIAEDLLTSVRFDPGAETRIEAFDLRAFVVPHK